MTFVKPVLYNIINNKIKDDKLNETLKLLTISEKYYLYRANIIHIYCYRYAAAAEWVAGSHQTAWREVSVLDLKAFFGICMLFGIMRLPVR